MNAYDEYGLYMANKHVIKLKSQTQPYYKLCSAIYTTSINNEIILLTKPFHFFILGLNFLSSKCFAIGFKIPSSTNPFGTA